MCLTLAQAPIRQWRAGSWDNRILDQRYKSACTGETVPTRLDHPRRPVYTGMANVRQEEDELLITAGLSWEARRTVLLSSGGS